MSIPVHAIASLKAALRAHLLANADLSSLVGTAIFDAPPRGAAPPYLVLGDAGARDNGGSGGEGLRIDLDVIAVTSERGTKAALTLASAIESALRTPLPALQGHHLVGLEHRQTTTRHDAATSLSRATLRLSAFTEPL